MKIDSVELFPSLLFSYFWEEHDTLNNQLRDVILEEEKKSSGILTSNAGGWHSEKNLETWGHQCVNTLLSKIIELALKVIPPTVSSFPYPEEILCGWRIQAWANVNRHGNFNKYHHHTRNMNLWSGVYYVDVGGQSSAVGGQIIFADQHRPGFKEQPALFARYAITPQSGLMLLFPSSLGHRVEPYTGTAERITVAFNLRHEKLTTLNYEIEKKQTAKKAKEQSTSVSEASSSGS